MLNSESTPIVEPDPKPAQRKRHPIRLFFIALLGVTAIAAAAGVLSGQQLRIDREKTLNHSRVEEQFALALQDLQQGQFAVAAQRLEYIVTVEPDYPGVSEKLDQAHVGMNATPTPVPTSTPIPSPTLDVTRGEQLILKAEQQFKDGDYRGMYATLLTLKTEVPDYQPVRADGLMWTALRYEGLSLINKGQISEGMYFLDLSKNYAPLDSKASDRSTWSQLILTSYQGAYIYRAQAEDAKAIVVKDGSPEAFERGQDAYIKSIQFFEQLYTLAPNYRPNIFSDYVSTLKGYGQILQAVGDACHALEQFEKALTNLPDDEELTTLRNKALEGCPAPVEPTPTPAEIATPTP
jgi:tetratricopeptide (TPR) repeat protein